MAVNFRGVAATFRIAGLASTPHNILALNNGVSGVYVALYEMKFYKDETSALATVSPVARVSLPASAATGGTALTKTKIATSPGTDASAANVVFLSAASADGSASAITSTAGTALWQVSTMRLHTLVGIAATVTPDVIPEACLTMPWVVAPSTQLLLQLVNAGTTGGSYYVDVMWEEWTTATG